MSKTGQEIISGLRGDEMKRTVWSDGELIAHALVAFVPLGIIGCAYIYGLMVHLGWVQP